MPPPSIACFARATAASAVIVSGSVVSKARSPHRFLNWEGEFELVHRSPSESQPSTYLGRTYFKGANVVALVHLADVQPSLPHFAAAGLASALSVPGVAVTGQWTKGPHFSEDNGALRASRAAASSAVERRGGLTLSHDKIVVLDLYLMGRGVFAYEPVEIAAERNPTEVSFIGKGRARLKQRKAHGLTRAHCVKFFSGSH